MESFVVAAEFLGEPHGEAGHAVAIYDKSVEYISGGTNVPDIKEFFWKWRRHHNPSQQNSLAKYEGNITLKGAVGMSYLGIFGATVVDDLDAEDDRLALNESEEAVATATLGAGFGGGGGLKSASRMMRQSADFAADGAVAMEGAAAPMAPAARRFARRSKSTSGSN